MSDTYGVEYDSPKHGDRRTEWGYSAKEARTIVSIYEATQRDGGHDYRPLIVCLRSPAPPEIWDAAAVTSVPDSVLNLARERVTCFAPAPNRTPPILPDLLMFSAMYALIAVIIAWQHGIV